MRWTRIWALWRKRSTGGCDCGCGCEDDEDEDEGDEEDFDSDECYYEITCPKLQ